MLRVISSLTMRRILLINTCRIISLSIFLLIIFACPISVVSSDNISQSSIPDIKQLELRVEQIFAAESKRDWRTCYNMSTFSIKVPSEGFPYISYEEYEKEAKRQTNNGAKMLSWAIKNIFKKEQAKSKYFYAAVEMDVVYQEVAKEPEESKDWTDYWVYINNKWYWTWRGWPHD